MDNWHSLCKFSLQSQFMFNNRSPLYKDKYFLYYMLISLEFKMSFTYKNIIKTIYFLNKHQRGNVCSETYWDIYSV